MDNNQTPDSQSGILKTPSPESSLISKKKRVPSVILAILAIVLIGGVGLVSYFVSNKLSTTAGVAPNAPESKSFAVNSCDACTGKGCNCKTRANGTMICVGCSSCEDTAWSPDTNNTCTTAQLTQTSNCGTTRTVSGTKNCCTDTTWTPDAALTCNTTTVEQTSNCGTKKTVPGTKVCTITCVPTDVITCTPDCPTTCGRTSSTITTCKDSCENAKTKSCPATAACGSPNITITKSVFQDEPGNSAGSYNLKTELTKVAKNQVFVYTMLLENIGDAAGNNITVTDSLTGQKESLLTFVDASDGCSYSSGDRKVTCTGISLPAGESTERSFRVKLSADAVNGDVIKNTAKVVFGSNQSNSDTSEIDLTISTVLGCNHTCTTDAECSGSLTCDTSTNKCRNATCPATLSCNCPTPTPTAAPTLAKCNHACNSDTDCIKGLICDSATSLCRKEACTSETDCLCTVATAAPTAEPTVLPETGILDIPGVAAFGGGLLMAVIGILLAL